MMAPQKIGFYFEKSLPASIPAGDDFSFIYIKNKKSINSSVWNKTDLYLGIPKPTGPEYIKLTDDFVRVINGLTVDVNGNIDLTLQDIVNKGNTIDNNSHIQVGSVKLMSDVSETNIALGNINTDFKDKSYSYSTIISPNEIQTTPNTVNNSLLYGIVGFKGSVNDSIMIIPDATNLNTYAHSADVNYRENIFIGGMMLDTEHTQMLDNYDGSPIELANNIYIRNLGYGNAYTYFTFHPKLILANDTEIISNESDIDSAVVLDSDNKVKKITKETLKSLVGSSSDDYQFVNQTNTNLKPKFQIISNNKGFKNLTKGTFGVYYLDYNSTREYSESVIFGQNIDNATNSNVFGYNNGKTVNSTIIGQNNGPNKTHNNSVIVGNNNFKNLPVSDTATLNKNYIYGNDNFINTEHQFFTNIENNYIFGNSNMKAAGRVLAFNTNPTSVNNNIILGDNNLMYGGTNNIILGNNNFNKRLNNVLTYNTHNTIVLGNAKADAEWELERGTIRNLIAIGHSWNNVSNTTLTKYGDAAWETKDNLMLFGNVESRKRPVLAFNPNQEKIWLESKVYLNFDYVLNTTVDARHNKLLTIGTDGDIGYIPDTTLKKESASIQELNITNAKLRLTGLTEDNNKVNYPKKLVLNNNGDIAVQTNNEVIINIPDTGISVNNTLTINGNSIINSRLSGNIELDDIMKILMETIDSKNFTLLNQDEFIYKSLDEIYPAIKNNCNTKFEKRTGGEIYFGSEMKSGTNYYISDVFTNAQQRVVGQLIHKKEFDFDKNWIFTITLNTALAENSTFQNTFGFVNIGDESKLVSDSNMFTEIPVLGKHQTTNWYILQNVKGNNLDIQSTSYYQRHNQTLQITYININGVLTSIVSNLQGLSIQCTEVRPQTTPSKLRFLWNVYNYGVNYIIYKLEGIFKFYELPDGKISSSVQKSFDARLEELNTAMNGKLKQLTSDNVVFTKNDDVQNLWTMNGNSVMTQNLSTLVNNNTKQNVGWYLKDVFPIDKDWYFEINGTSNRYGDGFKHLFGFSDIITDTSAESNPTCKIPNQLTWSNMYIHGYRSIDNLSIERNNTQLHNWNIRIWKVGKYIKAIKTIFGMRDTSNIESVFISPITSDVVFSSVSSVWKYNEYQQMSISYFIKE